MWVRGTERSAREEVSREKTERRTEPQSCQAGRKADRREEEWNMR